ncbi:hypothetical protein E2320_020913 [Naja naja]|nr:hypothetical protein E2320_020913 [Naja naja]
MDVPNERKGAVVVRSFVRKPRLMVQLCPDKKPHYFRQAKVGYRSCSCNLAVANLPASMASETTAVIPSNGVNILQIAPELPSVALQASEAIPYPQYGAQQLGISTSAPQQVPQGNPSEIFLKAEPKVLGFISSGSLCVTAVNRPSRPLRTVIFVPYQVIRGGEVTDEPNPPPLTYNLVTKSQ